MYVNRFSINDVWSTQKIKKCAELFICRFDNKFICLISEKFLFFNTASDLCLPDTRIFNLNSKLERLKLNYWTGSRKMVIFFSCTKNRNFSNFNKIFRWFISKLYIFYVSSIFFFQVNKDFRSLEIEKKSIKKTKSKKPHSKFF